MKDVLLAHVRLARFSYRDITNGTYELEFGALGTYRIEFAFFIIKGVTQAGLKLYKDEELLFWSVQERREALLGLKECIENL